jgi:hypothetical protein
MEQLSGRLFWLRGSPLAIAFGVLAISKKIALARREQLLRGCCTYLASCGGSAGW